jgi:hypothetical protein
MTTRADDRLSPAHIATALILLALQFFLMLGLLFTLSRQALDAIDCGYPGCDVRSVWWGLEALVIGGPVLMLLSAVVVGWRLIRRRRAVSAAITGCVLQVFLALFALMILGLA